MFAWRAEQVFAFRDKLTGLDLRKPADIERYKDLRYEFVVSNEGAREKAYDDATGKPVPKGGKKTGNITVGIGFNMDRPGARESWAEVFAGRHDAPNFDRVYRAEQLLTEKQMQALFDHDMQTRTDELERAYGKTWGRLHPGERMAMESAHFTSSRIVGGGTRFCGHMKNCVAAADTDADAEQQAKNQAFDELLWHSNRHNNEGLGRRRLAEAALLDHSGRNDENILKAERYWDAIRAEQKVEKPVYAAPSAKQASAGDLPGHVRDLARQVAGEVALAASEVGTGGPRSVLTPGAGPFSPGGRRI